MGKKHPVVLINSRCVCIWLLHMFPSVGLKKAQGKVTRQDLGNGCVSGEWLGVYGVRKFNFRDRFLHF